MAEADGDCRTPQHPNETSKANAVSYTHLLALVADGKNSATAYTAENVLAELRQYESYGVTTMLSLGVNRDLLYPIRQQQREGKLDGATVFTAGRGIGVPGAAPGLPAAPDQLYRPATPEAVSYTHLDVYKRQGQDRVLDRGGFSNTCYCLMIAL